MSSLSSRAPTPALAGFWTYGPDSILVSDAIQNRFTIFTADGDLVRTVPIRSEGAQQVIGLRPTSDLNLLVSALVHPPGGPQAGRFAGPTLRFERYDAGGTLLNTITEQSGGPQWGFQIDGRTAYTVVPFTILLPPNTSDGQFVYVGTGHTSEVTQWSPEGSLHRVIRWAEEGREVTDEVAERFRRGRLEAMDGPEARQMAETSFEGIEFPTTMPVYRRMLVDSEQNLWVERYRAEWEEERRWWVFDPSGRWLGEPDVPTDLDIREVGSDYLLGIRRDETEVESLAVYELHRGG